MKMNKTIGICATLLAALWCAVPQSAQAAGKIRKVEVISADGNDRGSKDKPLRVGDTIRITFHLVNNTHIMGPRNLVYNLEIFSILLKNCLL